MTIQRAREVLGEKYIKRTDEEIQEIISFLERLVNVSIDAVLAMPPEERKKHRKK